jgi:putative nucleotidyltransferase-like protein
VTLPSNVLEMTRAVVGFGLPGHESSGMQPFPDIQWAVVASMLSRERCTGPAVAAAKAGWLVLTREQWQDLLDRHRNAMFHVLDIERKLLVLAGIFDQSSVDFVVLKGSSLAHTIYPDPSWRAFGDLDLLVRTRDWRRACTILQDFGLVRKRPEPRPGFDERFGKAAAHRGSGDLEVDLHRTLVLGPFGLWIQPDGLFDVTAEFSLGGRSLPRFDDTMLLLHACLHAALGWRPPRLLPLRDVAQAAWFGEIDWDRLAARARAWRLAAPVQFAFQSLQDKLGVSLPEEATQLMKLKSRRGERQSLDAYTTSRRNRGGTARATLRAIPGPWAKARYIFGLLFPSPQFLDARALEGTPSHWRRWLVATKWLRVRRVQR